MEYLLKKGNEKNVSELEFNICVNNVIKHNIISLDNGKYRNIISISIAVLVIILIIGLVIMFLSSYILFKNQ